MSGIEIGSEWLSEKTNEYVTVIKVDPTAIERPCVWFAYKNGCESLLSVHRFTERFTKVFENQPKAVKILNEAVAIMAERGKSYDKSGGEAERSMPKIVAMFNALTGHELTPEQGWKFMCCLKLARSEQGEYREDNYLDGAAYMALAGEEAEASSE